MLQHERMTPVLVIPPKDSTSLELDSPWISLKEHHHITFYCMVGEHSGNDVQFKVRKYRESAILSGNYEARQVPAVFHEFRRFWRNTNTDATATQCLTLHLRQTDSTANSAASSYYGRTGDVRGQLIVIEISADALGKDSNGNAYDCVQLTVYGGGGGGSGTWAMSDIAALAILSEPRYMGRACHVPNVKVASRDW